MYQPSNLCYSCLLCTSGSCWQLVKERKITDYLFHLVLDLSRILQGLPLSFLFRIRLDSVSLANCDLYGARRTLFYKPRVDVQWRARLAHCAPWLAVLQYDVAYDTHLPAVIIYLAFINWQCGLVRKESSISKTDQSALCISDVFRKRYAELIHSRNIKEESQQICRIIIVKLHAW